MPRFAWSRRPETVPAAVGLFITAGDWFMASTRVANPAVTVAREFTDTFSGIAPGNVFPFIAARCCGALAAAKLWRWLVAPAAARDEKPAAAIEARIEAAN